MLRFVCFSCFCLLLATLYRCCEGNGDDADFAPLFNDFILPLLLFRVFFILSSLARCVRACEYAIYAVALPLNAIRLLCVPDRV